MMAYQYPYYDRQNMLHDSNIGDSSVNMLHNMFGEYASAGMEEMLNLNEFE